MENIKLGYLPIEKRFPVPVTVIAAKEADKIYLPPIDKKYEIYWMVGITVVIIFAGFGIYYLATYPPALPVKEEEKSNTLKKNYAI